MGGDLRRIWQRSCCRNVAERRMFGIDWRRIVLLSLLPFVTACGTTVRNSRPVTVVSLAPASAEISIETPEPAVPSRRAAAVPAIDPVVSLLAASDGFFAAGERELSQGHFEAARQEFD